MRVSILLAALFSSLSSVSAAGMLGFCLGAHNLNGTCKSQADFEADFAALAPYSNIVRIYSLSNCNTLKSLMPAAKSSNMKVLLGIWPTDDSHFQDELNALKKDLPTYGIDNVVGCVVGSEVLYRKELTATELANRINTVKSSLAELGYSSIPVGFADSWNVVITDAARPVIEASDLILVNAFSYWQGMGPDEMVYSFVDDIVQAKAFIEGVKGTTAFKLFVGETGWPTDGPAYKGALCSLKIAANYWQKAICGIRKWNIDVLVFEAFDEPGKPGTKSDTGVMVDGVEGHWGAFTVDRGPKYNLTCNAN